MFKSLLRDLEFMSLVKNGTKIFSGRVLTALLNVVAVTLAARALSPENFGVLAIVGNLIIMITELAALNSWQALIAFGSGALDKPGLLGRYVRLCAVFDILAHLLLAVVAIIAIHMGSSLFDIPEDVQSISVFFVLPLLFHAVDDTAKGLLRMFDKFALIAFSTVINAALIVVGSLICIYYDLGLIGFVIVYIASPCVPALVVLASALRLASQKRIFSASEKEPDPEPLPVWQFFKFLIATNLNTTVLLVVRRVDLFIIGALGGNAAAGVFRIVKLIASVPQLAQGPLFMAVFPQFGRLVSSGARNKVRRLSRQVTFIVGGASLAYLIGFGLFGEYAIDEVYGIDFAGAFHPTLWYLAGLVVIAGGLTLHPILLSYKRADLALYTNGAATVVFVIALYGLYPAFDLVAGGMAFLVYACLWTGLPYLVLQHLNRTMPATDRASPSD